MNNPLRSHNGISSWSIETTPVLPLQVCNLVFQAVEQAGGDPDLGVALLRERLVNDPDVIADRAILIRWLARQHLGSQLFLT